MSKPIEAWPSIQYRGKPGYNARHFRTLHDSGNDPLRVAERIVSRRLGDEINEETHARLAGGPMTEHRHRRLGRRLVSQAPLVTQVAGGPG